MKSSQFICQSKCYFSQSKNIKDKTSRFIWLLSFILGSFWLQGCAVIVSSATENLAENLAKAIANNDDPKTVKQGAPSYLIMIDSFVEGDPENSSVKRAASKLNVAYAAMFVEDPERQRKMGDKGLKYAVSALCLDFPNNCQLTSLNYDDFQARLNLVNKKQLEDVYTLGVAWSAWLQFHRSDWNAVAKLPQIKSLFNKVLALDDGYDQGAAHYYLALLNSILPPAMGGDTDLAQQHFLKAIALSQGKNLMVQVSYAEKYARLIFDQSLHDNLLNEVIAANPYMDGYVLSNQLAIAKAKELLASSADYF